MEFIKRGGGEHEHLLEGLNMFDGINITLISDVIQDT